MVEQVSGLVETGGLLGALCVFVWLAVKVLDLVKDWLPKFHDSITRQAASMDRQAEAVTDLAETSKATQETSEAMVVTLRALASETDRQSAAIGVLEAKQDQVLRGVNTLLAERARERS